MTRMLSPMFTVAAAVLVAGSVMSFTAFAAGDAPAKTRPGTEQQTACAISPARGPLGY